MRGYTTREVARLLGISANKVRSFARAGFISAERGDRGEYRFTFEDIVLLRTAKELGDARISPRRVWNALRSLRGQLPTGKSLASVRITAQGDQVVVRDKATAWDPESGQLGFSFSVAEVADQVAPLVRSAAHAAHTKQDLTSDDWYELGLDLELISATEDAKVAYRITIELDPRNADAHINFGRLLQVEGETDRAETHYRKALELAPRSATASFNLGTVLEDRGESGEAVESYRKAVQLLPSFADAHYNLAQLYEKRGNRGAALQHLARYKTLTKSR